MLRRVVRLLVIPLLALAAFASAQNRAQQRVNIRAGIVLMDSDGTTVGGTRYDNNHTPFVWFNLDRNRTVKPAGWTLYNPKGNNQVTDAVRTRWQVLDPSVSLATGDNLSKSTAAYWEVQLSTASDAQLADYDVLLLSAYGFTSMNSAERERLRKFVDGGGVLWIDLNNSSVGNLDLVNNFPIPLSIQANAGGGATTGDFFHPLLSYPNPLSIKDLNALEFGTPGINLLNLGASGLSNIENIEATLQGDSYNLHTVAFKNGGSSVASVGRIGQGFVVVTSRGAALSLNAGAVGGSFSNGNNRFYPPDISTNASYEAGCKLAVNLISLRSAYSEPGAGSRKTNSSPIDIGSPLMMRSEIPVPTIDNDPYNYFPPTTYKGLVVMSVGDHIEAYDGNPNSDLDGDGNPDDGLQDLSLGYPYDCIWKSKSLPGPISAPTCIQVSNPGSGVPTDQVIVTDANGKTWAFDAFPTVNGAFGPVASLGSRNEAWSVDKPAGLTVVPGSGEGRGPYAPTYHEGFLYVAGNTPNTGGVVPQNFGGFWMIDPAQGAMVNRGAEWSVMGQNGSFQNISEVTGSPTVGYIPIQDNSGGLDKVLYMPTRPSSFQSAGLVSIWLGAKGESPPPNAVSTTSSQLQVTTRAATNGLDLYMSSTSDALGVKLTLIHSNGDPYTASEMQTYFGGQSVSQTAGTLFFGMATAHPTNPDGTLHDPRVPSGTYAVTNVRVDYSIDLGQDKLRAIRGILNFADDSTIVSAGNGRRVIGNLAMSPRGTVYAVLSSQPAPAPAPMDRRYEGGSFYALREEGRGSFRLLTRYDLYPQYQIALNSGTPQVVPETRETLADTDPLQNMFTSFLAGSFTSLTYSSGPAVSNGYVYVTAMGRKNPFVAFGILMAFKAEPDPIQIKVHGLVDGNFTITQPDVTRSPKSGPPFTGPLTPTIPNVAGRDQFTYERSSDSDIGIIRMDNLMQTGRGQVQNAFSTSQPIIIRRPNQPDMLVEPDRTGSSWNPLQFYMVLHGNDIEATPVVTGGNVFLAGASVLPGILQNTGLNPTGVLTGIASQVAPNDEFLRSDPARPWQKQLWQLEDQGGGQVKANPNIHWPQYGGVQSFSNWAIRYLQTVMPKVRDISVFAAGTKRNPTLGVVAGDGALYAWGVDRTDSSTPGYLYTFSKADFIVADEGRLARFDPSGNPIWTTDSLSHTGASADVGSASTIKPLVRPTRAYRINENEFLAVDPGSNRIVRFDTSGRELRTISGFLVDPTYAPPGFRGGDPTTLNGPQDALVFTSYESGPGPLSAAPGVAREFWYHYVIADTSNRRIVELVDRYALNAQGQRVGPVIINNQAQLGVLFWHSPEAFSGRRFEYISLERVPVGASYYYLAGVGNALPTRVDTGLDKPASGTVLRESAGGNGGVVIFDPSIDANDFLINQVTVPSVAANAYWDDSVSSTPPAGRARGSFASPAMPQHVKTLSGLNSVTARRIIDPLDGSSRLAIMFTDNTGVYEMTEQPVRNPRATPLWTVRWMMPNEVFRSIRGVNGVFDLSASQAPGAPSTDNAFDLHATFARRLDSGEVLIVNNYSGYTRGTDRLSLPDAATAVGRIPYFGEVMQVNGDVDVNTVDPANPNRNPGFSFSKINLGFGSTSIRFELPPIQGVRGLRSPVFADRR